MECPEVIYVLFFTESILLNQLSFMFKSRHTQAVLAFWSVTGFFNPKEHRFHLISVQIYKQCVRPIFEYGSLSTITASDYIISKIQRLQNKFIRLTLRLTKYICSKLLHDSTGLPYVKDRLLSVCNQVPR